MVFRTSLIGQKFGRLTVIGDATVAGTGVSKWQCQCECGTVKIVRGKELKAKSGTRSCGCYNRDVARAMMLTHGMTQTATYRTWNRMRRRCENKNVSSYPRYGGRGIQVCDRWKSFENFLADMGLKPKGLTLERLDNNGNYCPENCVWATVQEQNNNKSDTKKLLYNGQIKSVAQLSRIAGVKESTFRWRIYNGWAVEEAIKNPTGLGRGL